MRKPMLMIPGPIDPPDEVLRRCGMPVFPHYETDFARFYNQLVEKMKYVFGTTDGVVQIPSGSGTTAVNMMLASLCTPDDCVLVLNNGGFGDYAERNLRCLGVPYTSIKGEHGAAIDPDMARDAMQEQRHGFIYVTHNESSTAVLNPLAPLGEIAREFDALLLVDAVSSVGGVIIDMDGSGADVVAGSSQKCLELPPGLAPVAIGPRAWEYMHAMESRRVPYVLDFLMWEWSMEARGEWHPALTTSATTMLYALDWMVDQIREEGLENRQERFEAAGRRLKRGMERLGLSAPVKASDASPVVTDLVMPQGMVAEKLRQYYRDEYNIMVGRGGRVNEAGDGISFRVAHFGRAAEHDRIDLLIDITEEFVAGRG